ncbi:hypothetical protein [Streptomyces sp. NPDC090445]|uniref:hypothetical protein n=1 Tax=Streptomyces sp. NPDC090445 TaxID=3365963 RepID=UPI0037F43C3C
MMHECCDIRHSHLPGTKWTGHGSHQFPDVTGLTAVAAGAPDDVWVLGERWGRAVMTYVSVPHHWNGSTWTARTAGAAGGTLTAERRELHRSARRRRHPVGQLPDDRLR